jgi:hypothetical protein
MAAYLIGNITITDPERYSYCVILFRIRGRSCMQHGHRGSPWMRATARRRRIEAIECGTWRSGRIGGATRPEAFG